MPEQVFLNEGGVQVTNARFVAKGRTFAINGITSVTLYRNVPQRRGPIIILAAAVCMLLYSHGELKQLVVSLVIAAIAVLYWLSDPTKYSVRLMTASGESDAFTSRDESQIQRIVNAVNEEIVARG